MSKDKNQEDMNYADGTITKRYDYSNESKR